MNPILQYFLIWIVSVFCYNTCRSSPAIDSASETKNLVIRSTSDGTIKVGETCSSDSQCKPDISGLIFCNATTNVCSCPDTNPVYVGSKNVCAEHKVLGEDCSYSLQCSYGGISSSCNDGVCECTYLYKASEDNSTCIYKYRIEKDGIDFTMLGILIGLVLMFIVLCVVLQMFSRARFKNQRTIFNSPHPRLLKFKLGKKRGNHRRGSRQPSVGSQTSPRLSHQGSRIGSRIASRESLRSSNGLGKTNPVMINQKQEMDDYLIPPASPRYGKKTSPEPISGPVNV